MNILSRLTVLACLAGFTLNLAKAAEELPKLRQKSTYKVGFSQTESNNPWRLAETESVKAEAAKRGWQLVYTDAAGSAAKQVADVNSMIAQHVDAILLAPREEKPLVPAVMAARKAGIPVVLLDRRVDPVCKPGRDYLTFIGSDFVEEGKRAADWLAKKKGPPVRLRQTTVRKVSMRRSKNIPR
jgi:ABC-type sugar transport system substrate-binding protein